MSVLTQWGGSNFWGCWWTAILWKRHHDNPIRKLDECCELGAQESNRDRPTPFYGFSHEDDREDWRFWLELINQSGLAQIQKLIYIKQ